MVHLSIDIGVDKPAKLTLAVALALLTAGAQATFAAPSRPVFPSYDIATFCFTDFGLGTLDATLRGLCNRDERNARGDLRRRWSSIPAQQLQDCVAAVSEARKKYGGAGSYQGLRNCVSDLQNAAEAARTTAAPPPPAPAAPAAPGALPTLPGLPTLPELPTPQTPATPNPP